jgi:hypothetical protein
MTISLLARTSSWNRSGYRCYKNYLIDDIVAFVYLGLKVWTRIEFKYIRGYFLMA